MSLEWLGAGRGFVSRALHAYGGIGWRELEPFKPGHEGSDEIWRPYSAQQR